MSKASTPPKIIGQLIKSTRSPIIDLKIGRFIASRDKQLVFPGAGTSHYRTRARLERPACEQLPKTTSKGFVETRDRSPLQISSQPEVTPGYYPGTKGAAAIRGLAKAFRARKREQIPRHTRSFTTASMSSELTKVLAKDACPRK